MQSSEDVGSTTVHPSTKAGLTNDRVQCQFCMSGPMSADRYQQHYDKNHDTTAHTCDICQKVIISKYKLLVHKKRAHPLVVDGKDKKAFMCDCCSATFKQERSLKAHKKRQHEEDGPDPGKVEQVYAEQLSKLEGEEYKPSNKCHFCKLEKYLSPEIFQNHFQKYHNKTMFHCPICNISESSKHKLFRHMRAAHDDNKVGSFIPCEICGKSIEENRMKRHVTSSHAEMGGNFRCSQCGKKFFNTFRLKNHVKIVHAQKNFLQCDQCDKKFMSKPYLDRHINGVHKRLKPFQCKICDKLFGQSASLCLHLKNIHKIVNPTLSEYNKFEGSSLNSPVVSLPVPD